MAVENQNPQGSANVVSVIIPSWNRSGELKECLTSLKQQDYNAIEIVVIDDGSGDDTPLMVKRDFPEAVLLADGQRRGHCHRRNEGIVASRGEYLLFLDSDIEFRQNDQIRMMVEYLKNSPTTAELGGEIAVFAGEKDMAFGRNLSPSGYSQRVGVARGQPPMTCHYLAGCNIMIRRRHVYEVGGFDPYYVFGHEDADFGYALIKKGYHNIVGYDYAIDHKASPKGRHPDESYRYCLARLRFIIKHFGFMRLCLQYGWDLLQMARRPGYEGNAPVLKAYRETMRRLKEIRRSRNMNFLDAAEMTAFTKNNGA